MRVAGNSGQVAAENANTINILLIGFNPVVQAGLRSILAMDESINVIRLAEDADDAVLQMKDAAAEEHPVDVVITPTSNNSVNCVKAMRLIKDEFPEAATLVISDNDSDSNLIDAIHAGADGYVFLSNLSADILPQHIHGVLEGNSQIKASLLRNAVDSLLQNGRKTIAERTTEAARLTEREVDVLRLMGNGYSNKEICAGLEISQDTAKKHVRNIISKLGAHSRVHACIIAAQAGIVGNPAAKIKTSQSVA